LGSEIEADLVEIGKVIKPHGVGGRVRVLYYGDSPEVLAASPYVIIKKERCHRVKIAHFSRHTNNHVILSLESIASREAAASLVGATVSIPKRFFPPLPEGEYYWFELMGLKVETEAGEEVGTVSAVFPTGSNDVYVVRNQEREVLVPATIEVVRAVDLAAGKMIIRPSEGLLG
jgi:16S rRNA processing protein RimM